MELALMSSW